MTGYFNVESGGEYKNMRAYMNAVKAHFIHKYLSKRAVLDLGIGRGQDIMKYSMAKVSRLIGVDADIQALQELVYRQIELIKGGMRLAFAGSMNVYIADLHKASH